MEMEIGDADFWPQSKNNTGRLPLCSILPVISHDSSHQVSIQPQKSTDWIIQLDLLLQTPQKKQKCKMVCA